MTFNEALEKKKEFGETYIDNSNNEYGILITPKSEKDLSNYFDNRYSNSFSFTPVIIIDADAKKYSTDGEFSIYAIKVIETMLVKKKLA